MPVHALPRLLLMSLIAVCPPAFARDTPAREAAPRAAEPSQQERANAPKRVDKVLAARINGQQVRYTATTGTILLQSDDGKPRAEIFYIAYQREGVANRSARPLTFSFNGGPGSSSVWLHLGVLGPRRVVFPDGVQPPPPPHGLADNEFSLLDVSDLVFIDPVGTGYSRPAGEAKADEFQGVTQDVQAVAEFIRRWTTEHQRWNSPKFLIGESYGTTRAAALVDHLQNAEGMFFNGVMLVSSILNFGTARFDTGNDLPYITFLPTYAATAWYHGRIQPKPPLESFLREARSFAETDYAQALMLGARLPEARAREIAQTLSGFIGLSPDFLLRANLRPSIQRFTKELLREQRRTVGRLDSRYLGIDADAAGETPSHDPNYTAILGPYTAALNHYLRSELGYEDARKYEILSGDVNRRWNWGAANGGSFVNTGEQLRSAMSRNPHLKVHVANGYYDLATPFFATEYTFDHLGLEPELRGNVTMSYYEAGHMMYSHEPSLVALGQALRAFVAEASVTR